MTEVSDRSGDPTLDELIEVYLEEGHWYDDRGQDLPWRPYREVREAFLDRLAQVEEHHDSEGEDLPLGRIRSLLEQPHPTDLVALRDGDNAEANCVAVTRHFVAFLQAHGLGAEEYDGKAPELYPELERDFLRRGGAHTWAEVKTDSGTFAVDWTASQYDCWEFPAVVRRSSAS
jgi:hypothetical protein